MKCFRSTMKRCMIFVLERLNWVRPRIRIWITLYRPPWVVWLHVFDFQDRWVESKFQGGACYHHRDTQDTWGHTKAVLQKGGVLYCQREGEMRTTVMTGRVQFEKKIHMFLMYNLITIVTTGISDSAISLFYLTIDSCFRTPASQTVYSLQYRSACTSGHMPYVPVTVSRSWAISKGRGGWVCFLCRLFYLLPEFILRKIVLGQLGDKCIPVLSCCSKIFIEWPSPQAAQTSC